MAEVSNCAPVVFVEPALIPICPVLSMSSAKAVVHSMGVLEVDPILVESRKAMTPEFAVG